MAPPSQLPNKGSHGSFCSLDSLAKSPINLQVLEEQISNYPDKDAARLLIEGFQFGFRLGYTGSRESRHARNHTSARLLSHIALQKLYDEVSLGRVAGPFTQSPFPNLIVSPIGLVEKATKGEFRLIFDLSYPKHNSVNEGIPHELCSVQYTSFDAVTSMVRKLGQGSFLVKVDIKSAFRLLRVHPDDFSLLGMFINGSFFIDKALPFGCSISCALFEKFATFLNWCVQQQTNNPHIVHYLDDYCGADKSRQGAQQTLQGILNTFSDLGVPVATEKVEGPSTNLKFLGLVVDTVAMEVRIPQEKLAEIKLAVETVLSHRKKVSLRELQSLIGRLNFACKAVAPGRAFCRRLINATIGVKKPHHRIRVSAAMRQDLLVWQNFLADFNGVSIIFEENWFDNEQLELFTDASCSIGFGAYFQGHWAYGVWPEDGSIHARDITFKELFPIVLALHLWGDTLRNSRVIFRCDNEAVVTIINKQSSRSQPVMSLVRSLVLFCLSHNILFRAKHIPGIVNDIADSLSRGQLARFRALAPEADPCPTPIPTSVWSQLVRK